MKLTTQILIALFAMSIGTSAVEAQIKKGSTKHHVKEGKQKDKAKDQKDQVIEVLSALEELDDVQTIFTNANLKTLQ